MQTAGEFGMRIDGGFVVRTPVGFAANTQAAGVISRKFPCREQCTDSFHDRCAAHTADSANAKAD